jgi:hypothetical protein
LKFFTGFYSYANQVNGAAIIHRLRNHVDPNSVYTRAEFNKEFTSSSDMFKSDDILTSFSKTPKTDFSSHATKLINESGQVYDTASMIAIIAYYRLLNHSYLSEIEQLLLRDSYLVFKGGVSVWKYCSFGLTDAQKIQMHTSFAKGGDNDTCLHLSDINVSDSSKREAYSSISHHLQILIKQVVKEFNIEEILNDEFAKVNGSILALPIREGNQFSFRFQDSTMLDMKIQPFQRIDDVPYKSINAISAVPSRMYTSFNELDLLVGNNNDCRNAFQLVRLKKAYRVERLGIQDATNTGAEILDISIPLPWQVEKKETYLDVQPISFW